MIASDVMILECKAMLFDLDGTLIDSYPAVERAWTQFSLRHSLDPVWVLTQIHGRRSLDSISSLLPHVDAEQENAWLSHLEATDTEGIVPLPGTIDFLKALQPHQWAIVTSGLRCIGPARAMAAGLPEPGTMICGDDVTNGKPHPEPFVRAAERLEVSPMECIGFEDTDAGMASIEAAGMTAIAIGLRGYRYSIPDLRSLRIETIGDTIRICFA